MSATPRLPVILLWHMHQPPYRDALTGQYTLPWTYLHATKDYTDMAAHLEANPAARAVVNFTPVLIEQLEELAGRIAAHLESGEPLPDPVLALLGPEPVPQAPAQRLELLRACLRANRAHMIERFGPYLELATIADTLGTAERVVYASDQFIQDLAVWYHLAWLGETVRRADPLVGRLTERGREFTAAQRRDLLTLIGRLVAQVVPRFRALAERGQVELSLTPYAHPIIPLLLDFHCARDAVPSMALPAHLAYPGGAARAAWHVEEGMRVFTRAFGMRPGGCWPAEGAISAGTLELLAARGGFRWSASSAAVLRGSLMLTDPRAAEDPLAYNRPYRLGGTGMSCFFRDDTLSDLIGFTYATWHGDDAAANLAGELVRLAERYAPAGNHAVLIALDGENAWEHYPFNGYYFLKALYAQLAQHPQLELTTLSEVIARGIQPAPLPNVMAGSWVHGTLATWMGDPAKNRAWDLLCDAKQAYDRVMQNTDDAQLRAAACRQLALCESSDWFWWFGDYNPAEAVSQFDRLYRRQLATLYRRLNLAPPLELAHTISVGSGAPEHGGVMRRATAG
ncbi:MAG TPA: glycoside hydrolase family 57 protein [Steroidobacteraceae bacterium]|jgi:alpha-amylase/alpha-mannosidase (GH57 family)|nr:glycoside hydrolase family 57 protein [Steroidobacteraceae bacterium]